MSSQPPDTAVLAAEVKSEDTPMAEANAPTEAEAEAEATPSSSTEPVLTKREFEIMTAILHRLTNYKDQEFVTLSPHLAFANAWQWSRDRERLPTYA
jgi:chromatin structure-remodeling complex subunit RSC1/2